MKQILQDLKTGRTILEEVPAPLVEPGHVLIRTHCSLVSSGTERMLVEFGKANYFQKAKQQPEKIKQVIEKIKTDGLRPTLEAVYRKLNEPMPLGYSNAGEVISVGTGVEFKIGQRVISNAPHAEIVSVPENLVALIPDDVTYEEACFTVIGAISLQGIRLVQPTFGETVVVIGLGLIGLITVQLLKANGCQVIAFDLDDQKVELARGFGIHAINNSNTDMIAEVLNQTHSYGADAVIITATTKSDEVISGAAKMSRKKGRIVLVGVVGLNIQRSDFYEKELSFQVSCSYGPGRYDDNYEQKGMDYPIGFVRWTEKRNFEAFLQAINQKNISLLPLITDRVPLDEFEKIYENISDFKSIASIIIYEQDKQESPRLITLNNKSYSASHGVIGVIGAGNFTGATLLPSLKKTKASLKYIASSKGVTGTILARKFGISNSTTDYKQILSDPEVDLIFITTRHHMHAAMVVESLNANKHVFVEKPLALNKEELSEILNSYKVNHKTVTVGFNRRFAPLAMKMKSLLGSTDAPVNIIATMNAGSIPIKSWVHDKTIGGGRIIGEACHLIDLCTYLTGSKVKSVCMNTMGMHADEQTDNASILLKYENGTNAVINYFANGSKSYPKERVEIFSQERTLVMDNWRKLEGFGFRGFSSQSSGQDKGHAYLFKSLVESVKKGGGSIIPMDEIINTTLASFAAIESMKINGWVEI